MEKIIHNSSVKPEDGDKEAREGLKRVLENVERKQTPIAAVHIGVLFEGGEAIIAHMGKPSDMIDLLEGMTHKLAKQHITGLMDELFKALEGNDAE